ncbi:MAG: ABC-F family ATP-binding cassette domain-containing protein [Archangiaceae bacterium]|nr:ABC-F family ATP-binding cassette domain-containing protein [Archangiaceae bacterium]
MSLVIVQKLSLSYGKKALFEDAALTIGPTDRIGLVGANGTGKSTFLKILVGQVHADEGSITFRRNARVGYLAQELQTLAEGPLVDAVLSSVPGRDSLDERLSVTERLLSEATEEAEQLELAATLAELHEERDHFEEHYGKHRAESILLGLGFQLSELTKSTSQFSGGWRMRAALAGLLLQDPDLLLLDEPTNHLDLPTLAWFDGFLKRSRKAMVLISHDREFLNRQINRVVSLEVEGVRSWTGNFEDYRRLRAEEAERLLASQQKIEAKRAQLQAFVDRFKAKASKAAQAQSKMKQLAKMETVEVHRERATVGFTFPPTSPPGRDVVKLSGIKKAFGEHVVYDGLDALLLRGQRVAVTGLNGAGKTTLLKLLTGELEADAGTVTLGHNVQLGYYAQHHADTLEKSRTILEEIMELVPDKPQSYVRSVLGAFLFSGDDVDKKIGVLSGGERARVALARLLVKPANLLVMDEPTNHLDLDSSEALIEALEDYDGTLIFVSHNRSFLDTLATHIWDVRDRKLVPFMGSMSEYLAKLDIEAKERAESGQLNTSNAPAGGGKPSSEKERKRLEAEARQERSKKLNPLKKELEKLEARIAQLEAEQKVREAQLADAEFAKDYGASGPVFAAHREAAQELEQALARWEVVGSEISALG